MFTGDEGKIIQTSDANKLKEVHKKKKEQIIKDGKDNYIEAEFFGLNTFNKLMDTFKPDCVGFRVYYGSRMEKHDGAKVEATSDNSGKNTSRLIIVPVDKYGNDLRLPRGMKDGEGTGMAYGPTCPHNCAPPTSD